MSLKNCDMKWCLDGKMSASPSQAFPAHAWLQVAWGEGWGIHAHCSLFLRPAHIKLRRPSSGPDCLPGFPVELEQEIWDSRILETVWLCD